MADISKVFRALVKTVKSREKSLGEPIPDKTVISPVIKKRGEFERKARELVISITKLRNFLLEHRKDYVNAGSHLNGENTKMTDTERDQIDSEAQAIIRSCQQTINLFKHEAHDQKVHPQTKEHRETVVKLIENYLKVVCKTYSEQKAVRVKRVVDRKRLSKLEPERKSISSHVDRLQTENKHENDGAVALEETSYGAEEDVSPEEAQLFEQENQVLFDEMNSLATEVRQIEGKVVEISRLQEIFADKVLEQDTIIDSVANTVVGTSENIKDANEEIREAMKNNAGFRVWILFFLVVCSFSLLFLDWYNG
ncbi:hypothetical protein ScPMuIL_005995 [Solemya velum]